MRRGRRRGRGARGLCAAAAAVLAALVPAGCGDRDGIDAGGEIFGTSLAVYSLLPGTPTGRDLVDGEKLAIADAGGVAGRFKVAYVSDTFSGGRGSVAETVRDAMRDTQAVAAIADLDSETAAVTIPMLNATGLLHVSPGATYPGFTAAFPGAPDGEPERWQPAPQPSFSPLLPSDAAEAEAIARAAQGPVAVEAEAGRFHAVYADLVRRRLGSALTGSTRRARTIVYAGSDAESARGVVEALMRESPRARILLSSALLRTDLRDRLPRGAGRRVAFVDAAGPPPADFPARFAERFARCPGPYAHVGYGAMRGVMDAIARAGARANVRLEVIRAHRAANPPGEVAARPYFLVSGTGCDLRYVPVG